MNEPLWLQQIDEIEVIEFCLAAGLLLYLYLMYI